MKDGEASGEVVGEVAGEKLLLRDGTMERETAEMMSWWPLTPPPSTIICSRFFEEGVEDEGGPRGSVIRRIVRSPQAAAISILCCSRLFGRDLSRSSSSSSSSRCDGISKSEGRMEAGGNEI